jgi:hypothetical protein
MQCVNVRFDQIRLIGVGQPLRRPTTVDLMAHTANKLELLPDQ